jgi:small subunit ribosomal protein S17
VYKKYIKQYKKYHAHDEKNECRIGDEVQIIETRPLSKLKRFRVTQITKKAV